MSSANPNKVSRFDPSAKSQNTAGSFSAKTANNQMNDAEEREKSYASSAILDKLSLVTDNLETYQGRDTIITLLHYIALILADFCAYFRLGAAKKKKHSLSHYFVNMFVQLSNCRVMLRLLDDFSAIREYYRFYKDESAKVNKEIID